MSLIRLWGKKEINKLINWITELKFWSINTYLKNWQRQSTLPFLRMNVTTKNSLILKVGNKGTTTFVVKNQ